MEKGNRTLANVSAVVVYRLARLLCRLPDSAIARIADGASTLVKRFGNDEELTANLADIAAIFRAGKPGSEIARRMVREARPHRFKSMLRGTFYYR